MSRAWTAAEVARLPVVIDVVTAGEVLGMGRSAAYETARRGDFPVPVLRVGARYRVVTAHLHALLGVTPDSSEAGPATDPAIAPTSPNHPGADSDSTQRGPLSLAG